MGSVEQLVFGDGEYKEDWPRVDVEKHEHSEAPSAWLCGELLEPRFQTLEAFQGLGFE